MIDTKFNIGDNAYDLITKSFIKVCGVQVMHGRIDELESYSIPNILYYCLKHNGERCVRDEHALLVKPSCKILEKEMGYDV